MIAGHISSYIYILHTYILHIYFIYTYILQRDIYTSTRTVNLKYASFIRQIEFASGDIFS